MKIGTKELIEVMNRNPMNEGRGRLCGRLDVLEDFLTFIESSDKCYKKVNEIEDEIKMIKDALVSTKDEEQKDGE